MADTLFIGNPSQHYGASPAILEHTVLPATRHRWTCPALTPAMQADLPISEGWKAEFTCVAGYKKRNVLPICRRSPIQVLTEPGAGQPMVFQL